MRIRSSTPSVSGLKPSCKGYSYSSHPAVNQHPATVRDHLTKRNLGDAVLLAELRRVVLVDVCPTDRGAVKFWQLVNRCLNHHPIQHVAGWPELWFVPLTAITFAQLPYRADPRWRLDGDVPAPVVQASVDCLLVFGHIVKVGVCAQAVAFLLRSGRGQ